LEGLITNPKAFVTSIVGAAISAFVGINLSAGKNWARVIFLLLFVLGLGVLLLVWKQILAVIQKNPVWEITEFALNGGIQCIVAYLLLSEPGSSWFRQVRTKTGDRDASTSRG
jgi:hypothetical protein